jgi:hypothetical protein
MATRKKTSGTSDAKSEEPLVGDDLMRSVFYNAPLREVKPRAVTKEAAAPRPTHYKVVSISLYTEDLERLDGLVAELKQRGHTKASRSSLIRYALDQVDVSDVPKSY